MLEICHPRYIEYFFVDVIREIAPLLFNEDPKQMERYHCGELVSNIIGMNCGYYANISYRSI